MRFGKTYEELSKPYKWFAWYPVCDYETGVIVWLEFVMKENFSYGFSKYHIIKKEPNNEPTSRS